MIFPITSSSKIGYALVDPPGKSENELKKAAIFIIESGDEDGVWLESIKQIHILRRQGIESIIYTGKHHGKVVDGKIRIPGESLRDPEIEVPIRINKIFTPRGGGSAGEIYDKGFEPGLRPKSKVSPQEDAKMARKLEGAVKKLKQVARKWMAEDGIDMIISQNANAIPMHLPLGVTIHDIAIEDDVLSIFHNHDFAWERGDKYLGSPYPSQVKAVKSSFPGEDTIYTKHMVINQYNLDKLYYKTGHRPIKLPNVMNFNDSNYGKIDEYNKAMLKELGIPENSLLMGQVTRIVKRKNIEASIELLEQISLRRGDDKVRLLISGDGSIGDKSNYIGHLKKMIKDKGLENQVHWVADRVRPKRGVTFTGKKIFSLSDFYANMSARGIMTYPSTYEGFGNAFVEAVLARVPIMSNNYLPVFDPELGDLGFDIVRMEGGKVTDDVVDGTIKILSLQERSNDMTLSFDVRKAARDELNKIVDGNFNIGKKKLSYDVAEQIHVKAITDAVQKAKAKNLHYTFKPRPIGNFKAKLARIRCHEITAEFF